MCVCLVPGILVAVLLLFIPLALLAGWDISMVHCCFLLLKDLYTVIMIGFTLYGSGLHDVGNNFKTLTWLPSVKAPALIITISSVWLTVMRRNPFMVDGCCRKGSRNALQELYNPTQVLSPWHFSFHSCVGRLFKVQCFLRLRFHLRLYRFFWLLSHSFFSAYQRKNLNLPRTCQFVRGTKDFARYVW